MGCMKEPLPGWIDNFYGPIGASVATYLGLLHVGVHLPNTVLDMIPIDYVVNSILASTWDTAINNSESEVPVYNCCTSSQNPITFGNFPLICADLIF